MEFLYIFGGMAILFFVMYGIPNICTTMVAMSAAKNTNPQHEARIKALEKKVEELEKQSQE